MGTRGPYGANSRRRAIRARQRLDTPGGGARRVPVAADAAIDALLREGVTHVFGGPGAATLPLVAALAQRPHTRCLSTRHGRVAGFMADGFARAGGELAACAAPRGPAATSLTSGLDAAYAESVPVLALIIEGDEPRVRVDPVALFDPVTKWSVEIRAAERTPELLQRAAQLAVTSRPRPVAVSVPRDVQARELPEPEFRLPFSVVPPVPQAPEIERAVELLAWSMRPAIVVGAGVERAGGRTTVAALADALGAPVACAWQRLAAFPNDHPAFVGALGPGAGEIAERTVSDADVVLALGCRLSRRISPPWTPISDDAALIQVDVDPDELGRAHAPTVALCGDAEAAARAILNGLPEQAGPSEARWQRRLDLRASYERHARLPARGGGIGAAIVQALARAQDEHDPLFVVDAPALGAWLQRHLSVTRSESYYGGGGPRGWGFGAALGAQLARPAERVLCAIGAGGFWSVAQDLETAVLERIPVVTLLVGDRRAGDPDLAAYARLVGAGGERVEREDALAPAIDRALQSDVPSVIEVVPDVDEPPAGVYPAAAPVGPGG